MEKVKRGDTPLVQLISFNTLLKHYEAMANSEDKLLATKAKLILEAAAPFPELREGFSDVSILEKRKDVIKYILQDTFPVMLGSNEIKTASLPFQNVIFNSSPRFKKIIKDAGDDFNLEIRDNPEKLNYILSCTVILNFHYGFHLDFKRPLFYDIPDANGVMRNYRILYNADFVEIIPTELAKDLTQDDVDELLERFDDLELWKEKIPPNSFLSKGFVISNMFDVTAEQSISEIKSSLIASNKRGTENFVQNLQNTFKSLFNIPDIRVGFVNYNSKKNQFEKVFGLHIESYILNGEEMERCEEALCQASFEKLISHNTFFSIADVEKYYELSKKNRLYSALKEQGVKSAILAPIADNGNLLGVLELVSENRNALNSVNATKLTDVMPYIVSSVLRSKIEEANLVDVVIQHECTSVHSSVYWRFKEEAKRFIADDVQGLQPVFREIAFKDVYPLYGQIDIKDSSQARNSAIQRDLLIQLSEINEILAVAWESKKLPIYEELIFRVDNHINEIKEVLDTTSEQVIFDFVVHEINPVFNHLKKKDKELYKSIMAYEAHIDGATHSYYDHRRNYDESVMLINKKLAAVIDKKQEEAQKMFPHFFERYKTDGVEHNMYIGDSIVGDMDFDPIYLNNLRLWQLQVMCEMENSYYNLKPKLPLQLDVASMILVYNTSLSIRFRMDEKRFDVDGTYNARYEVIKKRIDKSYIKGTDERLTQKGKLSIVYSQKKDELEYLRYIKFLKSKGYFTNNIEIVELEGLQGVSGLKAIRVEFLYAKGKESERTYTFDDLIHEVES
ncbi:cell surface protein [Sediminicola sp. YIK13]|uniref:GAF domain-containing protein n=1 Tax=Sediminicola sp. YIK13 TaxID=1453352 RepID=UPI00071FB08F|nr:GAF domain-containing protein [Sediminicola sp. YIK13]ALM08789.1 cell surface protein [Sediminicola sp. YIK13]